MSVTQMPVIITFLLYFSQNSHVQWAFMYILQSRMNHNEQRGTEHKEKDTQVDKNTTLVIKKTKQVIPCQEGHTHILHALFNMSEQISTFANLPFNQLCVFFLQCSFEYWIACLLPWIPNSLFLFSEGLCENSQNSFVWHTLNAFRAMNTSYMKNICWI